MPQMNTMFPQALVVNSEKKMNFLFYMPFNFNISFNLNWSDYTELWFAEGGGRVGGSSSATSFFSINSVILTH